MHNLAAPLQTTISDTEGLPEIGRRIRRLIGKAVYNFDLIESGDRIVVGLSGGKDSVLLLYSLACLRRWSPVKFQLSACSIDMTAGLWDTSPMRRLCGQLDVEYRIVPYPIVSIINDRDERSPCSLCAKLRRGLLNSTVAEMGCNKLALGHNLDDSVETTLMNLFRNGHFRCYQPKLHQDRSDIWVIRPLVYLTEHQIREENRRLGLEASYLDYCCPFSLETERSRTKTLVAQLKTQFPAIRKNIQHALETLSGNDQWCQIRQLRHDTTLDETGNARRRAVAKQTHKQNKEIDSSVS